MVNAWGRSHDVKNLFIVDGSILVTSGGVNPTSTIQALALYIADRSSSGWRLCCRLNKVRPGRMSVPGAI